MGELVAFHCWLFARRLEAHIQPRAALRGPSLDRRADAGCVQEAQLFPAHLQSSQGEDGISALPFQNRGLRPQAKIEPGGAPEAASAALSLHLQKRQVGADSSAALLPACPSNRAISQPSCGLAVGCSSWGDQVSDAAKVHK